MRMTHDYCKGCKKECNYIEVEKFIEYVNHEFDYCYTLFKCPDQTNEVYTCDLEFKDDKSGNVIHVEVKRVEFGFGRVHNPNLFLGRQNGQVKCAQILTLTMNTVIDLETEEFFDDFMVHIPLEQLGDPEIPEFKKELDAFFEKLVVDESCDKYEFIYRKKNHKKIKICFERKNEEMRKKFGNKMLYAYAAEDNNSLDSLQQTMMDVESLKQLVEKNFYETSSKKFPENAEKKILLTKTSHT